MGWSVYYERVDDPVAEVRRKLTWSNDQSAGEVLDAARVGNTVYAAVRLTKAGMAPYVFAAVYLIQTSPTFGYKDMDESVGPNECACPQRIMRLLTPLDTKPGGPHTYAADWRRRVAEHHAAKAKLRGGRKTMTPGARVRLAHPARFPGAGNVEVQDFVVVGMERTSRKRRTMVFLAEPKGGGGFRCRLSTRALDGATIQAEG